jgi:acyl-CoA oxidase
MFVSQQEGKQIFETWMLSESDNIQALAMAYGENLAMQKFVETIKTAKPVLQPRLTQLFQLYALDRIVVDGVFFLEKGFLNGEQSQQCSVAIKNLCTELGKDALEITKGFGIPDHMHHAPIANDWIEYNSYENNGELERQTYRGRDTLLNSKL